MTLTERFNCWKQISDELQWTNSIVEKRAILSKVPKEMENDVKYIFEILSGQHKTGFTFYYCDPSDIVLDEYLTIEQYLKQLQYCNLAQTWSMDAVAYCSRRCCHFYDIVEPIVNRTLKLGIGKSVLPKDGLGAMLGKAYEGQTFNSMIYVTEKLDGNRCIASFDGIKWNFTSRNGKPMKVQFDMTGLPTEYIYDGEVLSTSQTQASCNLMSNNNESYGEFNVTTGLINSKYGDKSMLVYNIFDIMHDDLPYHERREILNRINADFVGVAHKDWRIIPVLAKYRPGDVNDIHKLLDYVTCKGAEGLMINLADGRYEHKRTNSLLKYKKVKTMDLKVIGIKEGTGKYEGLVGALECVGEFEDKIVSCQVGSGLTDVQREVWALDPELIIGKIVEVAYFSESQNKANNGTTYYSLRFPRLRGIRDDKTEVSKY